MALAVQVAAHTDVGCIRANNEDNFGYDVRHGIYVVCDGMGGQAAGETASRLAVDSVLRFFRECRHEGKPHPPTATLTGTSARAALLASAIEAANRAVCQAAASNPAYAGMGTTLVAALVEGDFFSIAHVGDSRIYLVRDRSIQQLTRDHSLVMEHVRLGLMTAAEARQSSMQNIIMRALGSRLDLEIDVDDLLARFGDVLVLCTDGLTRHVSDHEIGDVVSSNPDLHQVCALLIEAACDAGGEDNVTCMVVRFEQPGLYKRFFRWFS